MQAHPLCAECLRFQPTLPARGATRRPDSRTPGKAISTHAPRTGSDFLPNQCLRVLPYFNPRSPHGERPYSNFAYARCKNFNPRSPHGERRLQSRASRRERLAFQPTLPARGATTRREAVQLCRDEFQPTLPARGATDTIQDCIRKVRFQPTLPARGATRRADSYIICTINFNPRSPHGERRLSACKRRCSCQFQPTLPARGATGRQK